ncbi:FMN-dependent dehydrogenase [Xylariaceae sp. FL1019]|nr:FMN-dependent dehydrogenase [Xylariaceae sp. FL1019]
MSLRRILAYEENIDAFRSYFLHPRILYGAPKGSRETSVLDVPMQMPVFISPTAMAKLMDPTGEVNITRAEGGAGLVQRVSSPTIVDLRPEMVGRAEGPKGWRQPATARSNS